MPPPEAVHPVTVGVLGPFRATVAGRPVDLGGPRQRAVLGRLVVAGGDVVSTDRLIHDLWDASDVPAKALAVLQVHVSHLRRALEPGRARRAPATVLISAAPGYALRLPPAAVDAWHVEDLVRRSATVPAAERHALLTAALDCWQGPAYAEVADEPWAVPEVVRLTELRLAAVEARAAAELALGRTAPVIADLERHLHDHPAREEAVRLLALALYRAGRQGDALGVLRRARAHLVDELGVDPGPALRALESDILAQSPSLAPDDVRDVPLERSSGTRGTLSGPDKVRGVPVERSGGTPATSGTPGTLFGPDKVPGVPLERSSGTPGTRTALGRDDELGAIAAAAEQAARDGARVVWIGGEAGAGKTTLAEAAVAALAARGWRAARGNCPEVAGAPPGWAWSEVAAGLGGGAPDELPADGPPNPFRLGRAVARVLDGPTVVLLDDVHRADDLTLQLLRQVVAESAGRPLLVLATYRSTELGDELAAAIGALLTGTAAHLRLGGLDAAAVAALARAYGLVDAPPDVLARLTDRTGGNPLFVRELARLIAAEGPSAAGTAVPAGVREVLRRRVARLPDSAAIALRQAAVLGRDVDVDVLAEVAGRDPDDLVDALEVAVLAGLLDEPAPGRVRFTHALVRDTLYDDTPRLRRTRLHTAALAVLRRHGADAATLAHHAIAAAAPATAQEALPFAVAAAREAEAVGAYGEASRQWAAALRLHETAERRGAGAPAVLDLLTPAVATMARAGDVVGARAAYLRALDLADTPDRRRAVLCAWDAPLIWTVRDGREPSHAVLDASAALLADPATGDADRVRLLLARFRELEGYDDAAAIATSGEALDLARGCGDARLRCAALNVRAYAALGPDLRDERGAVAEEYLREASAAGEIDHEAVAHWLLFLAAAARTDLPAALAEMSRAVARSSTGQLGGLLAVVAIFQALLDLLAGRVEAGEARYAAVARQLAEHGAVNGALMALVGRLGAAMVRGDLAPLRDELAAVEAAYPGQLTDPLVLALLDGGREAEARAVWRQRRPIDRNYYWLGFTALRGHAAARLGDRDAARDTYADLLPYAGRIAGADSGTLYAGPVDAALAALAAALGDDAAAARHGRAAAHLSEQVAAALAF